jgi:hypothetical protein
MNSLSEETITSALDNFESLPTDGNPVHGDQFFEHFGPGNFIHTKGQPFERFCDYEELLRRMQERDAAKYDAFHKGTPFYFLAWLSFDLRNYEKALYYVDAAISEDIRTAGHRMDGLDWRDRPASLFLRLRSGGIGDRTVRELRTLLSKQIGRFNETSKCHPSISVDDFVDRFVIRLLDRQETRTIISAFYIFLIEAEEHVIELKLKSTAGSSLGPILSHLFSGCLIFESLLKHWYPQKDNGQDVKALGDVFHTTTFKSDFGDEKIQTGANTLQEILLDCKDNETLIKSFSTTSRLRNTTGHNLVWDHVFQDGANYDRLVNQIVNAVLYLIERKYLRDL